MKLRATLWVASALALTSCARQSPGPQSNNMQPRETPGLESPAQAASAQAVPALESPAQAANAEVVPAASPVSPEEIVIPRETTLRVRLAHSLDTRRSHPGERFSATLDTPVLHGAHVLLPKGTPFTGHVTEAKPSGRLRGRAALGLSLDFFEFHGRRYPIATASVARVSRSHKKRNTGIIGGMAAFGTVVGAIAGGPKGALLGAGAGAAAGTAGAAFTGKKNVHLPAESRLSFALARPVTVYR